MMLRTIASKIPLRRSLHTSSTGFSSTWRPGRVGTVLGTSAAVAYLAWKSETIALDTESQTLKLHAVSGQRSAEPLHPTTESEPSGHEKHVASSSTVHDSSSETFPSQSSSGEDSVGEAVEGVQDDGGGGAYDPVTGEINWDCSCLGGMAYGPCGMQFREAFSCFVHSEEEPKGIDCVEKFKAMQNCFREHPEVYGDEIMDDDEDEPVESSSGVADASVPQSAESHLTAGQDSSEPLEGIHRQKVVVSNASTA